jgi:hypothetical protein
MNHPLIRLLAFACWFVSVAALAGLLVGTIHKGHLGPILIIATGLAGLVIVPIVKLRFAQTTRP